MAFLATRPRWKKVNRNMITLIEGDIPVNELPDQVLNEVEVCWNETKAIKGRLLATKWPEGVTISQHHGSPAKFCIRQTEEELLAARYMFNNDSQFIVVKQKVGTTFYGGRATVISFASSGRRKSVAEGEVKSQYWNTWVNGINRSCRDVVRLIGTVSLDDSSSSSSVVLPLKYRKRPVITPQTLRKDLIDPATRGNEVVLDGSVQSPGSSTQRIGHASEELEVLTLRKRKHEDDSEYQPSTQPKVSKIPKSLPGFEPKDDGTDRENNTSGSLISDHASNRTIEHWRQNLLPITRIIGGNRKSATADGPSNASSAHSAGRDNMDPVAQAPNENDEANFTANIRPRNNDSNTEKRQELQPIVAAHPGVFFHFKKSFDHPDTRVCPLEIISSPITFAQHASCAGALAKGSDFLSVRIGESQRNIMIDYHPDYQWVMQTAKNLRFSSNEDIAIVITPGEW